MGKRPDYSTVCDASVIMDINIEYIPSVDLEAEFQKPSFISEFVEVLSYLSTEDDTVLYGQNGCYVSTYSVCMYNIHDNKLSNGLRSYIFTNNKEEVGEFFLIW